MSADRSIDQNDQIPDLAELLARMATPETPREALALAPEIQELLEPLT
jgi:hypothetical protein